MNRDERIRKIQAMLRQRRVSSFAQMLAALEVSPPTLKRDLAYGRAHGHAHRLEPRRCRLSTPDRSASMPGAD